LKAPFAAIHANAQLLLNGHCGRLPPEAVDVLRRISARCRRLAREIQDMLQLANLGSSSQEPAPRVELDLSKLLRWCIDQVWPMAREHAVVFDSDIGAMRTRGVEDHLKMLLMNLLTNAVAYSHKGGVVRVRGCCEASGGARVTIADEGIGIPPEKLPSIFDAYYRTNEAVRHNKESSGLGLTIVKEVAELHGIRLRVTSRLGAGTTFELEFPGTDQAAVASGRKEDECAVRGD